MSNFTPFALGVIFKKARDLMTAHPRAIRFQDLAERLLNKTLRPYTARWHGWMTEDNRANRPESMPKLRFQDEQVRRQVTRGDLNRRRRGTNLLVGSPQ